jgi:RecB family endonuclease NucS
LETGYPDFTARDADGKYVFIEVKRVIADKEAVRQLHRYTKTQGENDDVRGLLVAPGIKADARRLLTSLDLEFKPINLEHCARLAFRGRMSFEQSLDVHLS